MEWLGTIKGTNILLMFIAGVIVVIGKAIGEEIKMLREIIEERDQIHQAHMGFEKLEDLLPYPVHCIEEKITMKPKEAIEWGEYEQELCDKAKQKKLKQTGME